MKKQYYENKQVDKIKNKMEQLLENYNNIIQWNKMFDVEIKEKEETKIEKEVGLFRHKLIAEEIKELGAALEKKDPVEITDALCDILVTTYGAMGVFGVQLDKDLLIRTELYVGYPVKQAIEENCKECSFNKNIFIEEEQAKEITFVPKLFYFLGEVEQKISNLGNYLKKSIEENKMNLFKIICHKLIACCYFFSACMSVDINRALKIVNDSNVSKGCQTEEEAKESVKVYESDESKRYESPAYRKSKDEKIFIVYNKSDGKILKNKNWSDPTKNLAKLFDKS